MMRTLFRLECKTHTKSLLIWIIVVAVLTFGLMSLFPSMKDTMSQMNLNAMPKQMMMKAFNLSNLSVLSTIDGYFSYEFQYIMIATGIFAAMLGTGALAGEEAEGTIGYLYAQPISRSSIVSAKMLSTALLYTLYWVVSITIAFLVCLIFKESGASVHKLFKDFFRCWLSPAG
ncbi:ABC transporter permease subunit [Terrilactibacillus sp. S3-3]|nr:ABC transporter permease subunit [Terrilactibacillus sp. S3-3]